MIPDSLRGSLEVPDLLRQLCVSPASGHIWFALGVADPRFLAEAETVQVLALGRSLILSPQDEAATRALLRLVLRLNGVRSALSTLFFDERVSQSYESMGVLAVELLECGETARAVDLFFRCFVLSPGRREAPERLGQAFLDSGRYLNAAAILQVASRIAPEDGDIRSQWALSRHRAGHHECYDDLLSAARTGNQLQPLLNAAMAAVDRQCWEDAIFLMSRALILFPGSVQAWSKSAIPLILLGHFPPARVHIDRSLSLDSGWLEARVNLGRVFEGMGDFRAAIREYEAALELRPDLQEPRLNAGTCYLGLGQFERGWEYYSARWHVRAVVNYGPNSMSRRLVSSRPQLRGSSEGARVLVWTEQGVGDEIMFCSILPDLLERSREVSVTVDDRLVPLLSRSFPSIRFLGRQHTLADDLYDFHLPMGDLGGLFRQSASRFEGRGGPFLSADPSRIRAYRSLLRVQRKLIVGVSWHSANPNTGSARSVQLERLVSSLKRSEVKLVCLQYGRGVSEEVREFKNRTNIEIELVEDLDLTVDLDGVAAVASACDLVVSVGNSVAHLSAACGVRTWLLASVGASWRWMFEGSRTPWYDSVRIYRQRQLGSWDAPLDQISKSLDVLIRDEVG